MTSGPPDNLGEDLSAYLDGELSPERTREIERILADRPEARAELEALRAVSQQLSHLPHKHAPHNLAAELRRPIETPPQRVSKPAGSRTLRLFVRFSAVAAVLIGGVLVGWQLVRHVPTRIGQTALAPQGQPTPEVDRDKFAALPAEPAGNVREQNQPSLNDLKLAASSVAPGAANEEMGLPLDQSLGDRYLKLGFPCRKLDALPPQKPVLVVTITPQTQEQYQAAYALLSSSPTLPARDLDDARRAGVSEKGVAQQQQGVEFAYALPPTEVSPLVAQLERYAPQHVSVTGDAAELAALQPRAFARGISKDELAAPTESAPGGSPAASGRPGIIGGGGRGGGAAIARTSEAETKTKSQGAVKAPAGSAGDTTGRTRRVPSAGEPQQPATPVAGGHVAAGVPAAPPSRAATQPTERLRATVSRDADSQLADAAGKPLDQAEREDRSAVQHPVVSDLLAGLRHVARFLQPPPQHVIVQIRLEPPPTTQPAATTQPSP